jgi:hypothetical protein
MGQIVQRGFPHGTNGKFSNRSYWHGRLRVFPLQKKIVIQRRNFTLVVSNQSLFVPHNLVLDDPQRGCFFELDISSVASPTDTLTLMEPGGYHFYCDNQLLLFPSHREKGMQGHLIVH